MHAFIHRDEYACIVSVSDVLCNSKKNIRVSDVLPLFTVEHTSALDHAVVGNPLTELPSTGRSNRLGGGSNRLGQEERRKPRFAALGGTPSGTVRQGLF
jgi:hypothetical protein